MNEEEMRFSQQVAEQEPEPKKVSRIKRWAGKFGIFVKIFFKKVIKVFVLLVLVVLIITAGFWLKKIMPGGGGTSSPTEVKASVYSAIFLVNGQVYFGKLASKNSSEIVLTDVFYLQIAASGAQTQLSEPKFSLIKLGNELHGPTDELFINTSQVLFYENLRDDSKVVESIRNYK